MRGHPVGCHPLNTFDKEKVNKKQKFITFTDQNKTDFNENFL